MLKIYLQINIVSNDFVTAQLDLTNFSKVQFVDRKKPYQALINYVSVFNHAFINPKLALIK